MAAKEQWKEMGNVPAARQILAEAFAANPDSEVSASVKRKSGQLGMQASSGPTPIGIQASSGLVPKGMQASSGLIPKP